MAQFEQIPFDVWFYGSRKYQTIDTVSTLNPFSGSFYKFEECYIQVNLYPETGQMWIVTALGTGTNWMSELRRTALKNNVKEIHWITHVNNRAVNSIAKYWKCDLLSVEPNYYGEYSANHWVVDLSKPNPRLGKTI